MDLERELLIIELLRRSKGEKYSVKKLHEHFIEEYPHLKVSYTKFLRYIDVLIATEKIKSEDWKFVRFIWVD